jgi:hypothetical protein
MSRVRNGIIGSLVVIAACQFGIIATNSNPVDTEYRYIPPPTMEELNASDPYMARTIECKEFENKVQPCHRLNKGRWELVLSFSPTQIIKLSVCDTEDGGSKLPCIWQDTNSKKKKSDPTTRNVFWKGNLK